MLKSRCMRLFWFVAAFTLLHSTSSLAMITFEMTFGGPNSDGAGTVLQTPDEGYIILGQADDFDLRGSLYLIKTDSLGDTMWTENHTAHTPSCDGEPALDQTSDGGYVAVGYTSGNEVRLVKMDSLGDVTWSKTFPAATNQYGHSVQQTLGGGYIIAGHSFPLPGKVNVIKTDPSGSLLWQNTYGGGGEDAGWSVCETFDGHYVIAGGTYSFGPSQDVYLIKMDSLGDTTWTKTYGSAARDAAKCVKQTPDGGYIITGYTFAPGTTDVYLVKTDSLGDSLWAKLYGGIHADGGESVDQTLDGGYIITGKTASFGAGGYDLYLIRTDSIGDTIWTRTYGGSLNDVGKSVRQTQDGGYIIAGYTESSGAGGFDVYLIKTDENGLVGIEEQADRPKIERHRFELLQNEPNPFARETSISYMLQASGHIILKIYDASGRVVATILDEQKQPGFYTVSWDGRGEDARRVASGSYFVRLEAEGFEAASKMIVVR